MHTAKPSSLVALAAAAGAASAGWVVTAYRLRQARTDELTGLPLRGQWQRRASRWLHAHPGQLRMVMVDLDQFKHLNDTHGHPTGDAVLQTTAQRLCHTLPAPARMLATRLGGDEFVALHTHPRPEDEALLHTCLSLPIPLPHGETLSVSASLGSVLLPAPPPTRPRAGHRRQQHVPPQTPPRSSATDPRAHLLRTGPDQHARLAALTR